MFGLFRPRCPLEPHDKLWVETTLHRISVRFGRERVSTATPIDPSQLPSPDSFARLPELFQWMCNHFQVESDHSLTVHTDGAVPTLEVTASNFEPIVLDLDKPDLRIAIRTLLQVVGLLLIPAIHNSPKESALAGLLAITALGGGNLVAGTVLPEDISNDFVFSWWDINRHSILPPWFLGYAMAVLGFARNRFDIDSNLPSHVRDSHRAGSKYLQKTRDCFLTADNLGSQFTNPSATELVSDLRKGSDSRRLWACSEIQTRQLTGTDLIAAVETLLDHGIPEVRAEAAWTIAFFGPAAGHCWQNIHERLLAEDDVVQAAMVLVPPNVGVPVEEIMQPFHELMESTESLVIDAVGRSIAEYGAQAKALIPSMVKAMVRCMVDCDFLQVQRLLFCLTKVTDDPKTALEENLEETDSEIRKRLIEELKNVSFEELPTAANEEEPNPAARQDPLGLAPL